MIHTVCGWEFKWEELVLEYWHGILCGASCPKCGGDASWVLDDESDLLSQEEIEDLEYKFKARDLKK